MKILVTGDRNWSDEAAVERHLKEFGATEVIEGEARGADTLARVVAERNGWKVYKFPANWDEFGKAAGVIRNSDMIAEKPDLVLAFHDSISKSKGTKDCAKRALAHGMTTYLVTHNELGEGTAARRLDKRLLG
jgi:hypothetical protein